MTTERKPPGQTPERDAFYAYFLTFLIIWIVWRQHHRMFDQFGRVTPRMVAWHFPLLLFAAFLPYASTTYGHYADNPMAALRGEVLIDAADREDYRAAKYVSPGSPLVTGS